MDDTNAPGSPHDLLLRLAGRVDDDLLADARELVAVGEDGHALELVTAALAADGTALPPAVRAELVAARRHRPHRPGRRRRPPPGRARHHRAPVQCLRRRGRARHRRGAGAAGPAGDGIRLRLAWRQTPAGPAPTSLPYPVLLVESPADGRPGEVLAYQMGAAMARSDVHVAVEVLTSGKPLTSYHAAALRDSTPLSPEAPPRQASPPEKVESVVAEVVERGDGEPPGRRTRGAAGRPVRRRRRSGAAARPVAGVAERAQAPRVRRAGSRGRPRRGRRRSDRPRARCPARCRWRVGPGRELVGESEQATAGDPLAGPLNQPLMDPLLDPTPATEEGGWTDEWASGDWALAEEAAGPPSTGVPPALHAVAGGQAMAGHHETATGPQTGPDGYPADRNGYSAGPDGNPAAPRGDEPDAPGELHAGTPGPDSPAGPQGAEGPHGTPARGPAAASPQNGGACGSAAAPYDTGPHAAGTEAAGPQNAVLHTTGPHNAGPHNAALHTTGPHLADPHSADREAITPRASTGGAHTLFSEPDDVGPRAGSPVGPHAAGAPGTAADQPDATPAPLDPAAAGAPDEPTNPGTPVVGQRASGGPAHALAEPPTGPLGAPFAEPSTAEALLRPEALARLSDEDRELLTRLQAELAGGAGAPFPGGPNGSNGTADGGSNGSAPG